MKCSDIQFQLPLYADGVLPEASIATVRDHLQVCPVCRQAYSEIGEIRNALRRMRRKVIPVSLSNSIKAAAINERRRLEKSWFNCSADFTRWLQMRFVPYSIGVLGTVLVGFIFLATLFSNLTDHAQRSTVDTSRLVANKRNQYDDGKSNEISPEDYARLRLAVSRESPSVNPNGALIALTKRFIARDMKDDEVVVIADVFGNGLARIVEVVEPSRDKRAVQELSKALATDPAYAPFVPANLENRPENMRVILRFQSVNVSTNQ